MDLFPDERRTKRAGSLEGTGEGEVIGLDGVTAHVREVKEGRGQTTVLDGAGDESGPGDNGAVGGE